MLQMATSNMVVVNDTHRTQKQIAELFFQAFTLFPNCLYPAWFEQYNIAPPTTEG